MGSASPICSPRSHERLCTALAGILLDQMLVGTAASLVNLIIHAVPLGAVVWTVRRLEARDTFGVGLSAIHPS